MNGYIDGFYFGTPEARTAINEADARRSYSRWWNFGIIEQPTEAQVYPSRFPRGLMPITVEEAANPEKYALERASTDIYPYIPFVSPAETLARAKEGSLVSDIEGMIKGLAILAIIGGVIYFGTKVVKKL